MLLAPDNGAGWFVLLSWHGARFVPRQHDRDALSRLLSRLVASGACTFCTCPTAGACLTTGACPTASACPTVSLPRLVGSCLSHGCSCPTSGAFTTCLVPPVMLYHLTSTALCAYTCADLLPRSSQSSVFGWVVSRVGSGLKGREWSQGRAQGSGLKGVVSREWSQGWGCGFKRVVSRVGLWFQASGLKGGWFASGLKERGPNGSEVWICWRVLCA